MSPAIEPATEPAIEPAIECDEFIGHPPAAVWKALTDPDLMARWWVRGDIRPVIGHEFALDMGGWGTQTCRVTAVEPERLLQYSFAESVLDSVITWRLVPEGTGTRLFLQHAGFDLDSPLGRQAYEGMGRGWPAVQRRIASVLAES